MTCFIQTLKVIFEQQEAKCYRREFIEERIIFFSSLVFFGALCTYIIWIEKDKNDNSGILWGGGKDIMQHALKCSKFPFSLNNQNEFLGGFSSGCSRMRKQVFNPYPTAFPYGNGMVLHFYQQQESSTTKTVHKVINKGLKTYV